MKHVVNQISLGFGVLLTLLTTVRAQSFFPNELPQVLDIAYKKNQQLAVRKMDIEVLQLRSNSYSVLPKTNFDVELGQLNTNGYDNKFSVSQEFPGPGMLKAKRAYAEELINGSRALLDISKQELTYNIRQSWYQWAFLQASRDLLNREDSLLQEFVRVSALRFKAGETNLLEKATAEAKQLHLLQDMRRLQSEIETEKSRLRYWLNTTSNPTIETIPFTTLQLENVIDTSQLKRSPLLLQARQQVRQYQLERDLTKAEAGPVFRAGYFIQSFSGPLEVDGQVKSYNAVPRFQGVELGVGIPILGRKGYRANLAAAEMQIRVKERELSLIESQLKSNLEQLLQEHAFWVENVKYYKEVAIPNAELIIKNSSRGYQSGNIGYFEYAQSLQTSLQIQRQYLDAINNLNQTVIQIQFLLNQ